MAAPFLYLKTETAKTIEVAAMGHKNAENNGICHLHYSRQSGSLEIKVLKVSGRVHDACDGSKEPLEMVR